MNPATALDIRKDLPNRKLFITRYFDAPPELVWRAWTEAEWLDQWWAPKPYRAETRFLDFREGGHWLYAMVGPDLSKQWAWVDFLSIHKPVSFTAYDFFCDEEGKHNPDLPGMHWKNDFRASRDGTEVLVELSFKEIGDLEKVIEMGFEQGFQAALGNLDECLASQANQG